jgi:hypothetical protein
MISKDDHNAKRPSEDRLNAMKQEAMRLLKGRPAMDAALVGAQPLVALGPSTDGTVVAPATLEAVPGPDSIVESSPSGELPVAVALATSDAADELPAPQRRAARLNPANDPNVEQLYNEVAREIVRRRTINQTGVRRANVAVTADVYSRVSRLGFSRQLDKAEVVTYLLDRYLPPCGREAPQWLQASRVTQGPKLRNTLGYLEDDDLQIRLVDLKERYGLLRVQIVEAIVMKYLPPAPHVVVATRRPKRAGA